MKMKLGLNFRLSQSIKLTPLLQQSIKFLNASQSELNDLVEEYIADNIFLTAKDKSLLLKKKSASHDSLDGNYYDIFNSEIKNQTLREYLIENISIFSFSPEDQLILSYLIDSIDENGYLVSPIDEIASSLPLDEKPHIDEIEKLLKLIQNSTHPGIGARDLAECLLIQLKLIEPRDEICLLAISLVKHYLNLLANKNYDELMKNLKCNNLDLEEAIILIKKLNPKPGLIYQKINKTSFVNADVFIKKINGNWITSLNEENSIELKIIDNANDYIESEPNQDLKEKLQEAKWLIKNLNERSISILRVVREIMKNQINFLEKGESYLKPLTLKEIAFKLELHESTISRISSNKFIETPHGIYEIKFFFNNSLNNNDDISSKSILHKIRSLINNEDSKKPYSDSEICNILKKSGINIARRTVAKYRIKLNILPSNQRKV